MQKNSWKSTLPSSHPSSKIKLSSSPPSTGRSSSTRRDSSNYSPRSTDRSGEPSLTQLRIATTSPTSSNSQSSPSQFLMEMKQSWSMSTKDLLFWDPTRWFSVRPQATSSSPTVAHSAKTPQPTQTDLSLSSICSNKVSGRWLLGA